MAYDVFISFKNTATNGGLTLDRAIAERLHSKLRAEGLEVFFSEKDLDNAAFMTQIYGALEEAQTLILIGTSLENINSRWVKSEWQNFLGAINSGKKPNGQIITVLDGIGSHELPIEISNFQSFAAADIDSLVSFVFKSLGKTPNTENAERMIQAQGGQLKEAEATMHEPRLHIDVVRKTPVETQQHKAKAKKSRAVIIALVAALVLAVGGAVFAIPLAQKSTYTYTHTIRGLEISGYSGSGKRITLPNSYKGEPIVGITSRAFENNDKLLSVVIPDGVTLIDSSAFRYCDNLTSVTLPDSVTKIGSGAFKDCSSLTSVIVPESVSRIYPDTFSGCTSLSGIDIPDTVTSIDKQAFLDCTSLTNITIPDSVTSIDLLAFFGCTNLTVSAPHEADYYNDNPSVLTYYIKDWIVE